MPLRHTDLTAVASLFDDYTVFAVNANSSLKTGKDLIDRLRKVTEAPDWKEEL